MTDEMKRDEARMWVFGYGSLIWHPEFSYDEAVIGRLDGWHRSFCMRSIHHRGTVEAPGLVLALDAAAEATCQGVAFRVSAGTEAETLAALRARELVSSAYLEKTLEVALEDGRRVEAVTYVIDPAHEQYCQLPLAAQAEIIAHAVGGRGPNAEYLQQTAAHLADLGIGDTDLDWLAQDVRRLQGG